jgi:RNA ligase (TIGR02306 family)
MSTFRVTAEQLTILPHPNADALELAQVGLYRAVVRLNQYRTGDLAIYIPEAAILPPALAEELGLTGYLAGRDKNRVKAVRLRGELSQGIVCSPSALAGVDLAAAFEAETDFSEVLGVTKWVPEIPANMSGEIIAAPRLVNWIDIENIKRYPDAFAPDEPVTASEKIHGSACLATVDFIEGTFMVSSKGFGARGVAILEDVNNLYWRALRQHEVESRIVEMATLLAAQNDWSTSRFALFGEVYGAGVQDLTYGVASRNTPGYAVFDAFVEPIGAPGMWIDQASLRALTSEVGLPMVPEIYAGPFDYDALATLAEGPTVAGGGGHIREGLVIRPTVERWSQSLGGRAIAKMVGESYLTRKGETTEFE